MCHPSMKAHGIFHKHWAERSCFPSVIWEIARLIEACMIRNAISQDRGHVGVNTSSVFTILIVCVLHFSRARYRAVTDLAVASRDIRMRRTEIKVEMGRVTVLVRGCTPLSIVSCWAPVRNHNFHRAARGAIAARISIGPSPCEHQLIAPAASSIHIVVEIHAVGHSCIQVLVQSVTASAVSAAVASTELALVEIRISGIVIMGCRSQLSAGTPPTRWRGAASTAIFPAITPIILPTI